MTLTDTLNASTVPIGTCKPFVTQGPWRWGDLGAHIALRGDIIQLSFTMLAGIAVIVEQGNAGTTQGCCTSSLYFDLFFTTMTNATGRRKAVFHLFPLLYSTIELLVSRMLDSGWLCGSGHHTVLPL